MSLVSPRRAGILSFALLSGVILCLAGAAELKIPPSPERWATDTAGFLSPAAVQELDLRLEAFEQQSGHQVLVYIGKTTEGYPIEDFAARTFQAWKVGRKGLDDGLVLFIMAEDRTVRIEVGYGLEGAVPDITAGRILNDILIPKIRSGDRDGAVRDAVAAVLGAISGTEPGPQSEEPLSRRKGTDSAKTVFLVIAAIIFLMLFITNPSFALWLLINIMSGRGGGGSRSSGGGWGGGFRGGGGFGGGGFRGGGGRSGGGGASGRW